MFHCQGYSDFVDGLRKYFDRALGSILLYRFEREQFEEICKANKDKKVSELYGIEHLCRLFMKLPYLLTRTFMEDQDMHTLQIRINDLLRFLGKESTSEDSYKRATAKYSDNFEAAIKSSKESKASTIKAI